MKSNLIRFMVFMFWIFVSLEQLEGPARSAVLGSLLSLQTLASLDPVLVLSSTFTRLLELSDGWLEGDLRVLKVALEHAAKARAELMKSPANAVKADLLGMSCQ